jgi:hypothetical protein
VEAEHLRKRTFEIPADFQSSKCSTGRSESTSTVRDELRAPPTRIKA